MASGANTTREAATAGARLPTSGITEERKENRPKVRKGVWGSRGMGIRRPEEQRIGLVQKGHKSRTEKANTTVEVAKKPKASSGGACGQERVNLGGERIKKPRDRRTRNTETR